jgi:hypothetical protein
MLLGEGRVVGQVGRFVVDDDVHLDSGACYFLEQPVQPGVLIDGRPHRPLQVQIRRNTPAHDHNLPLRPLQREPDRPEILLPADQEFAGHVFADGRKRPEPLELGVFGQADCLGQPVQEGDVLGEAVGLQPDLSLGCLQHYRQRVAQFLG